MTYDDNESLHLIAQQKKYHNFSSRQQKSVSQET